MTGDGSPQPAPATVRAITDAGGVAIADTHDVATPEGGQAIVDVALEAWGRIDILVNNAGFVRDGAFEDMTAELLSPLIDVLLKAAFYTTQARLVCDAGKQLRQEYTVPGGRE